MGRKLEHTMLPIPQPNPPTYTQLDACSAKPPHIDINASSDGGDVLQMTNRLADLAVRPLWKALIAVVIVAVLTAIVTRAGIAASQKYGRLAAPPAYDDVVYFVSAAQWLVEIHDRSSSASILALLKEHAPYSTISAIIGFLLTPDNYVAHYAINFVPVAAFFLGITWLIRHSSLLNIATCLVGVACVPLIVQTINEARPDLPWGLATGLALGATVYRRVTGRSIWSVAVLGLLCGLAALIKPTALAASIVCLGFALLTSAAADWFEQNRNPTFKDSARRILVFGAAFALAVMPYLIVSFGHIWWYIRTTWVEQQEFWVYQAGLHDHLVFYVTGSGGGFISLSRWFQVGIALFAVRIGFAAWLDRNDLTRAIALLLAVTVAYAVPTAAPIKTYFLGAMFYSAFVVSMALNYTAITTLLSKSIRDDRSFARPAISAVGVGVLLLLLGIFQTPMLAGTPRLATVFGPEMAREIRAYVDEVWSIARSRALELNRTAEHPLVVRLSSPLPVSSTVLQLYAVRSGIAATFNCECIWPRFEDALGALVKADMAVVTSTIGQNIIRFPVPKMGDDLIRALDARPDMCLEKSMRFGSSITGNSILLRVYQRHDLGCPPPAQG